MKPLTHCPHCHCILVKKDIPEEFNNMKYENCRDRCVVDYFQHYDQSYDEPELQYVTFNTPDGKFSLYYYTKHHAYSINLVHVYSEVALDKNGWAFPFIVLKDFHIDFDNLHKLQEKLSIYAVFS